MSTNDSFLKAFETNHDNWRTFAERLSSLIAELLQEHGIDYHLIESRAKTVDSVREKLQRPGKSYENPEHDLPDLVGIRVVLYDKTSVGNVQELIDSEFDIDMTASSNKLEELAPDQFGYLSIHKIIRLNNKRAANTEWKRFREMHAEVQIRTVLQHAWASISHKLQYKRESEIPVKLRRRLTRLAGLFELADDEFQWLQNRDAVLRQEIKANIKENTDELKLDAVSVAEFAGQSEDIKRIGDAASKAGFRLLKRPDVLGTAFEGIGVSQLLTVAIAVGCRTVSQLESAINQVVASAEEFFEQLDFQKDDRSGTISHFAAVLLLAASIKEYPANTGFPFENERYINAIMKASAKVFK